MKIKTNSKHHSFSEPVYWGVLLISPWLAGFLIFKLFPILASLILSLTDFFLLEPARTQFIGLENYAAVLKDSTAGSMLWKTINQAFLVIPLQIGASIIVASILTSKHLRMKNIVRALFFLPSIIPSVAAVFMWESFASRNGWLNRIILNPFGLGWLNHLYGRNSEASLVLISSIWMLGPGMLIIAGAMQGISQEIYEAAIMDGAGRIKRFVAITLPLITPAIFFTIILNLTSVFGGAILLDRGRYFNSQVSSYDGYIYTVLFGSFKLGLASSLAWTFFLLAMGIVLTLFVTSKYWVYFPDQDNQ